MLLCLLRWKSVPNTTSTGYFPNECVCPLIDEHFHVNLASVRTLFCVCSHMENFNENGWSLAWVQLICLIHFCFLFVCVGHVNCVLSTHNTHTVGVELSGVFCLFLLLFSSSATVNGCVGRRSTSSSRLATISTRHIFTCNYSISLLFPLRNALWLVRLI